ncbi:hypothetical protein C2845_PM05G01330 [Panicum miliaceum]|uniref:MATH domain-containing protein n=1 Tax=Panicum miliaceum TaxID=4540 RepID=A0A3L6SZK8_PANMI|nr:hypothetical protein C2845_PM05G01330 [Panicum miliaceum]
MSSGPAPTLLPFGRLAPGALSGSATRARQATGTHLHRIDGYSLVDGTVGTGKAVRSSRFLVGGHQWELLYYPNGVNHLHRGFVSVDLTLAGCGEPTATATATASYRVSILDYAGNPVHSRIVGPRAFDRRRSTWTGVEELVATEELAKTAPFLVKDDRLNVRCDVAVLVVETKPRNRAGWARRAAGLGTGGERQTGHVGRSRSQRSTHRWWKACAHSGSTRSTSPPAYSPRHTAQHGAAGFPASAASSPSSPPYTTLGSALSAASTSAAFTPASPAPASAQARHSRARAAVAIATGAALREHMRSRKATVTTARATCSSTIPAAGVKRPAVGRAIWLR